MKRGFRLSEILREIRPGSKANKIRGLEDDREFRKLIGRGGERRKVGRPNGSRLSADTRKKISDGQKGRIKSKAEREKIAKSLCNFWRHNRRDVQGSSCMELRVLKGSLLIHYIYVGRKTHCINGEVFQIAEWCLITKRGKNSELIEKLLTLGWRARNKDLTIWSKGTAVAARIITKG